MKSGSYPYNRFTNLSPFASEEGQTDPCKQDTLACANDPQISEKVNSLVSCGHARCTVSTYTDTQAYPTALNPAIQSSLIQRIDRESGTSYHKIPLPPVRGLSRKRWCLYLMKWFKSPPRQGSKMFCLP
jgi:hypothetical protein